MRKALYLFGSLSDEDVVWMADNGRVRDLAAGESLILRYGEVQELCIALSGVLKVHVDDKLISRLRPGELVGEMSFVEEAPPAVSVSAVAAARVLALPFSLIHDHAGIDTAFAARLYRGIALLLSDRLRGMTGDLGGEHSNEDSLEGDQLSGPIMETLAAAGQRFGYLQALVEG